MTALLDATALLRPALLGGTSVVVVGRGGPAAPAPGLEQSSLGASVQRVCASLGAVVQGCAPRAALTADAEADAVEQEVDGAIAAALTRAERVQALVIDADALLGDPGPGPDSKPDRGADRTAGAAAERLRTCMLVCWAAARSLATRRFIGEGQGDGTRGGGRIVLLAPRPDGRAHAAAAAAGLENVARTLSIEWARYAITVVALAPGAATPASEVATVTAYLLSPAGTYFSGCLLDLRGEPARERS